MRTRRADAAARRRALAVLLALAAAPGCDVRARPDPAEPDAFVLLSVEVLSPRDGETIVAGRNLTVRVRARDLRGDGVVGVGYVARRIGGGGATVDSASVALPGRVSEATEDFTFAVPAALATNTHLEVVGLAFGPGTSFRQSVPRAVVVARCESFQPCD